MNLLCYVIGHRLAWTRNLFMFCTRPRCRFSTAEVMDNHVSAHLAPWGR